VPVVLCAADDHYAKSLTVTLQSAAAHLRPGHSLQVIVMDGGIKPGNWQKMKESLARFPVQLNIIRPDPQIVDGLTTSHHITRTAYFRLLAGKLLPETIDRVIYLDSDLLIQDDLSWLWEMEMGDEYCLAVPDIACPHIDAREANCNYRRANPYLASLAPVPNWRELNLRGADWYFNSGVMVLNIDRWRRESVEQRLLQCLQDNRKHVWCWDQYALNVVFAGDWRALPARWNQGAHLFDYPDENHSPIDSAEFIEARDNPAIIHYTTEWKPWHFHNRHPHRNLFFQQLDQTAWAGWRPERPPFRISHSWNRAAVRLVKSATTTFRKVRSIGNQNNTAPRPIFPAQGPATTKPTSQLDAQPLVTLFAIPKAFTGKNSIIQENAIRSWRSLEPIVEILLIGDDFGVAEAAQRLGVVHIPGVETNDQGTPLLSSAFRLAEEYSQAPLLMYSNCDIIYLDDFITTFEQLASQERFTEYLGIGRRIDLPVENLIDFQDKASVEQLEHRLPTEGKPATIVCKDYFIFPKGLFSDLPKFAVGRGNWDNWMVHTAKQRDIPVINLSQTLSAVHQEHDYTHAQQSRRECYATGREARQNQQLGGGRHLISGSTSTWFLGKKGLQPARPGFTSREFWLDIPRFALLLRRLFCSKSK